MVSAAAPHEDPRKREEEEIRIRTEASVLAACMLRAPRPNPHTALCTALNQEVARALNAHRELFTSRLQPFQAAESYELFRELAEVVSEAAALN